MLTQAPGYRRLAYLVRILRDRSIYRPLLRHHRIIFIHIPKTGGQSVSYALFSDPDYVGHESLGVYERENPAHARNFFSFSFVRNPYDRLLSAYRYLMHASDRPDDIEMRETVLHRYTDFEKFVRGGLRDDPAVQTWWHFRPQTSFLTDRHGRIGVAFVGRFETLTTDFETVRARLGFGDALPWLNKSTARPAQYQDAYTAQTAAIVAEFYRDDFDNFGYPRI